MDSSYALFVKKILIDRNIERDSNAISHVLRHTMTILKDDSQMPDSFLYEWSPENLGAIIEFIIWDYENNDFVKCGKITSKTEILFGMSTGVWLSLVRTIPIEIFKDTPFEIPVTFH